jgi:hypothetical protein
MQIIKDLIEPMMRLRATDCALTCGTLLAREVQAHVERDRGIIVKYFDPIAEIAIELLRRAVPILTIEGYD